MERRHLPESASSSGGEPEKRSVGFNWTISFTKKMGRIDWLCFSSLGKPQWPCCAISLHSVLLIKSCRYCAAQLVSCTGETRSTRSRLDDKTPRASAARIRPTFSVVTPQAVHQKRNKCFRRNEQERLLSLPDGCGWLALHSP